MMFDVKRLVVKFFLWIFELCDATTRVEGLFWILRIRISRSYSTCTNAMVKFVPCTQPNTADLDAIERLLSVTWRTRHRRRQCMDFLERSRIRSCAWRPPNCYRTVHVLRALFMASFQETILKLEGKCTTACDLFAIMDRFRKSLITKVDDSFFGMKVKMAIRKKVPGSVSSWEVRLSTTCKSGFSLTSHHTATSLNWQ